MGEGGKEVLLDIDLGAHLKAHRTRRGDPGHSINRLVMPYEMCSPSPRWASPTASRAMDHALLDTWSAHGAHCNCALSYFPLWSILLPTSREWTNTGYKPKMDACVVIHPPRRGVCGWVVSTLL